MIAMWVGLELTLYGMGLVFLLLALLWGLISLLVKMDRRSEAEDDGAALTSAAKQVSPGGTLPAAAVTKAVEELDPELLAAIVVACRAHRMSRRKQAAPEMRSHQPGSQQSRWVGAGRTRQNRSWAPRGRSA